MYMYIYTLNCNYIYTYTLSNRRVHVQSMYSVYIRVCIYTYISLYIHKHIYAYMLVITSNNIGHTSHLSQVLCESKPTDAPYANAIGWHTHTQTKHNIPLPKYRHATQLPTITQTRKHAYAHAHTCMRVQCTKIFTCTPVCNPCQCACPRARVFVRVLACVQVSSRTRAFSCSRARGIHDVDIAKPMRACLRHTSVRVLVLVNVCALTMRMVCICLFLLLKIKVFTL